MTRQMQIGHRKRFLGLQVRDGVELLHLREHFIKYRNLSKDKIENVIKQLISIISDSEENHRDSLLYYKI